MKKNKNMIIIVIGLLLTTLLVIGGTYAYFTWRSSNNQKTNVVLTVSSKFSCTADGGGSITNQQKKLAPTTCNNSKYAFQRTIKTTVTNNKSSSVYLDLWLDIKNIGSGLSASDNFKYVLAKQANNCSSNIVAQGTFKGKNSGDKVMLISAKEYAASATDTLYLYVWLDMAEGNVSTQDQPFYIALGGQCIDG